MKPNIVTSAGGTVAITIDSVGRTIAEATISGVGNDLVAAR